MKITDKNFNIVILLKNWYKESIQDLFINEKIYLKYNNFSDNFLLYLFKLQVIVLKKVWSLLLLISFTQYILNKIKCELLKFYIILKVYKDSWKEQFIVLLHSWITFCISEVINYILYFYLKLTLWIINLTQDIILQIKEVRYYYFKKV